MCKTLASTVGYRCSSFHSNTPGAPSQRLRVHLLLRLLDVLLELLERLLRLLAVLDEAEVLLLELGEDVEQLLRLLEVHLEHLVVVAALVARHTRHAAACVVHLRALTRAARRPLPANRNRQVGSVFKCYL